MIEVDISNIWGQVTLRDLLALEKEVSAAHAALADGTGAGSEHRGWMTLPCREATQELKRLQKAAARIRRDSQVCVVVGIGGSCLGAKAVIELLQGPDRNLTLGQGEPMILYAGSSLSTRQWQSLTAMLEGKSWSVIVISKSGTTTEPAIAFRSLRWMLERKYGTDEARKRIYAVTDPTKGALRQMAAEEGWESFAIPADTGSRFCVLSPAGLLPMAVAGIDILQLLGGAADAREACQLRSFENPAWLYAAVRTLMQRSGKSIELLSYSEPGLNTLGRWWQKLFAESEGKEGRGLFPVCAEYPADLHTLGQLIQDGPRSLFETMLRFDPPRQPVSIGGDWKNLDGLNYLEGKELSFVEEMACQGALEAHVDGGVPVISISCGTLDEAGVGALLWFMELSCAISAYIQGVNPFNQPGTEACRHHMFTLLGKPGFDS